MSTFILALLFISAGGTAALFAGRKSRLASFLAVTGTIVGSALGLFISINVLLLRGAIVFSQNWQVPGGEFALAIDPLSACFLLPIFVLSPLCALYGAGYLNDEGKHRILGPQWFFLCLLIVAMALVVTAANGLLFVAVWELMSLSSFFLVAFDHRLPVVQRSAWTYLLACHVGAACLFALFLLAGHICGSLQFSDFGALQQVDPGLALALFLLAVIGFGTKAGLFPLHVWLPDAHPAAPSHVSALMSGVMVKTGIYGILRVLTLLPLAPIWWGGLLAGCGIIGAVYGIALATQQRDVKRCLAYSTVENVGIIFLGLGVGLAANSAGLPQIAALALAGGLLHIWNHALFKGVMFLGAGTLLHATGTRDMNLMGGLLHKMPLAGGLIIGGSLAIAALPPFNGLVSEWLIYLGMLQAGQAVSGFWGLFPYLLVGMLGITGALAVVAFTRIVGIALLGEPRSEAAKYAHEASALMTVPMALLLAGCLLIGLLPQVSIGLLQGPIAQLLHSTPATPLTVAATLGGLGRWGALLILLLAAAWLLLGSLRKKRPTADGATWGCGFSFPSARMSYTAEAYGEMVQHLLPRVIQPEVEAAAPKGLFPGRASISQRSIDPALQKFFYPGFHWLAERCVHLRWLQQGKLPVYLLYIFFCCAVLLVWSVIEGRI
ncbi:MAG: hydrogenase [Desulfuromonadaceae bacterium]|nr:hydrogenase [Desulfuromonadaceae bacterium]